MSMGGKSGVSRPWWWGGAEMYGCRLGAIELCSLVSVIMKGYPHGRSS